MANPTLSANGSLQINLLAGRVYSFSTGGDFSGGTLASELLLDDDTPVPISDFAKANNSSPQTSPGTINFLASSTRIRLTLTGATNPSITYAITLTTSVIGVSNGSEGAGNLISTNNLSDLANTETARTNLGLGTAATTPASAYAPSTAAAADIGRALADADEIIVGDTKSALSRVATYLIGAGRTWLGNHIFSGQTTMPNQIPSTADAVMLRRDIYPYYGTPVKKQFLIQSTAIAGTETFMEIFAHDVFTPGEPYGTRAILEVLLYSIPGDFVMVKKSTIAVIKGGGNEFVQASASSTDLCTNSNYSVGNPTNPQPPYTIRYVLTNQITDLNSIWNVEMHIRVIN